MTSPSQVRDAAAKIASMFSINKTSILPGVTWDQMSERTQIIVHTTCQQVAEAIFDMPLPAAPPQPPDGLMEDMAKALDGPDTWQDRVEKARAVLDRYAEQRLNFSS